MTRHLLCQEELRLLDDQARSALQAAAPHQLFTSGSGDADAIARRHWSIASELGWPGMLLPADKGGLGLGLDAAATVAARMGEQLFCGPFLATAVWGSVIAEASAAERRLPGLSEGIARGDVRLALAALTHAGTFVADAPTLAFARRGDEVRLNGARELVEHAGIATHILALDLSRRGARVTLKAALVPAAADLRIAPRQALDVTAPVAAVVFADIDVPAADVFEAEFDADAYEHLLRPVDVVIAAELTGIARGALDRAVAHAKERKQFGAPIGSFQAVKHRLADGYARLANAELALREASRSDDGFAARAARLIASEAALRVTGDLIQVLGGMGFSWESDAHLYLKRARRLVCACGRTVPSLRRMLGDAFIASVIGEGRAA